MQEESDWLTRQIRAFAEGLGYMLSHEKSGASTQIVFPQKDAQEIPHQAELQHLIDTKRYSDAAERLFDLRYALLPDDFFKLGLWFYSTLNEFSPADLATGNFSKDSILAGVTRLKEMTI
ncbi:DUF6483 family protein [Lapidilactobacillus mulanensis]|uniref:DUF6483 family protein n=1 Tax=Lapidilactobacillus mulanensis TaxID=2485999 RepID=A0ABW4DKU9_9LACO|nr:DUF6483 family protein [Lapidilactobacillus mulanensis]